MDYLVAGAPDVMVTVHSASLACCAVEVGAAIARGLLVPASDHERTPSSTHVLVVAGTVTHTMLPALRSAWERLPEPKAVMSFGACANSGGPYWDSYSVVNGIDSLLPVASYVPGCPPHPEGLIAALVALGRDAGARSSAVGGA